MNWSLFTIIHIPCFDEVCTHKNGGLRKVILQCRVCNNAPPCACSITLDGPDVSLLKSPLQYLVWSAMPLYNVVFSASFLMSWNACSTLSVRTCTLRILVLRAIDNMCNSSIFVTPGAWANFIEISPQSPPCCTFSSNTSWLLRVLETVSTLVMEGWFVCSCSL